jgi:hypothetical protein
MHVGLKIVHVTYDLVTKEPILIVSGKFVFGRFSCVSAQKQNFGGHKFKRDREVETVATRWQVTQDRD